jgi:ABC-type Na+ efflux pump permease subunit
MTFLPVVERELRVAARRRSTYWWRTAVALIAIFFGAWLFLYLYWQQEAQQVVSRSLFNMLTGCATLYALLSGAMSTTDCLSSEKREGTLGLLFLTDLKGYDVVFGKLAAGSLKSIYGVMAVLPMLAIPMLIGGIAPGEVARMGLVALNALFFSLALGMALSAVNRSARAASQATFALLFLITVAAPICSYLLEDRFPRNPISPPCRFVSPGFSYVFALEDIYKTSSAYAAQFWESVATINALGWGMLLFASLITPRSWQDKPAGVAKLRWRERWRLWSYGDLAERKAFRKRLLDTNAFFWLTARSRLKPACVWAVLGLIACGWTWGIAEYRHDWLNPGVFFLTGLLLNALIKIWFCSEAGRQLAEDRSHGTLELLLSTPLSVADILEGQLLALMRQFLGPLMVIVAADLFFMAAYSSRVLGADFDASQNSTLWVSMWIAAILMLAADLVALYWVGQWQALVSRNPTRAAVSTQMRILVFPWVPFVISLAVVMPLSTNNVSEETVWKIMLGLWVAFGLAADLLFGLYARGRLLSEFRLAASHSSAELRRWSEK